MDNERIYRQGAIGIGIYFAIALPALAFAPWLLTPLDVVGVVCFLAWAAYVKGARVS
jgi:hypothetical protein